MTFELLAPDLVRAIHDAVLNPGELTGEALNKSLELRDGGDALDSSARHGAVPFVSGA